MASRHIRRPHRRARLLAARLISLAALTVASAAANAVGLGSLQVQSWLSQPLRANVSLLGADHAGVASNCIRARVESAEGTLISNANINVTHDSNSSAIVITTSQPVFEPAMMLAVSITCDTPVHRKYQVLLDPVGLSNSLSEVPRSVKAAAGYAVAPPVQAMPPRDRAVSTRSERKKNRIARSKSVVESPAPTSTRSRDGQNSVRPSNTTQVPRSVLKLSGGDTLLNLPGEPGSSSPPGLKLATALAMERAETDPVKAEQLREAQARYAALLRDEDPLHEARIKARSVQERSQILQAELDVLREQSQLSKSALDALQKKKTSSYEWIAGLSILLLTCLLSIAWLAWRLRSTQENGQNKWWENSSSNDEHALDPVADTRAAAGSASAEPVPLQTVRNVSASSSPAKVREVGFLEKRMEQRPAANSGKNGSFPFHGLPTDINPDTLPPHLHRVEMIKVEEISDTLQEVEFWMSLNDRARALEILEPLSKVEQPDSPGPWLYLLDIYRGMGDEVKYEALRERCERNFNVRIVGWSDPVSADNPGGLEDFPHLLEQICLRWKGDRMVPFLEQLLIDDREGARAGFELPAYRDLMLLIALAKEMQPTKPVSGSEAAA